MKGNLACICPLYLPLPILSCPSFWQSPPHSRHPVDSPPSVLLYMRCSLLPWCAAWLPSRTVRRGRKREEEEGKPAGGRRWVTEKLPLPPGWWWQIRAAGGSGAEHINEIFKKHEKLSPNCSKQLVVVLTSLHRSCFQSIVEAHGVSKEAWLVAVW